MTSCLAVVHVPAYVCNVVATLKTKGYDAYVVGGGIRDSLLGLTPKDWDVATSATPLEVMRIFKETRPTGLDYGTVTVLRGDFSVEVTTFRSEQDYVGHRPTKVSFGHSVREDLSRRDFVLNAIALDPISNVLEDPYGAMDDIARSTVCVRAVGRAEDRFMEDPLRMLRLFYLLSRLDKAGKPWIIEGSVWDALCSLPDAIGSISPERVFMELNKIIVGPQPDMYFRLMYECGLLARVLPELASLVGIGRCKWHIKDAFSHTLDVTKLVDPDLTLRWAALLHDLGKATTMNVEADGEVHFYGHDTESARLASDILSRLRASKGFTEDVVHLVKNHMFAYPSTKAGVRKLITRIGNRALDQLLELRRADILTARHPDLAQLEELEESIEEVLQENPPLARSHLALDGNDVMQILGIGPGPKVGEALDFLLQKVIEDPSLNTRECLTALLDSFRDMPEGCSK